MNNSDTEILDDSPSGYMSDIDGEMDSAVRIPVQNAFRDISEFYVSRSGHTRLLTATRFGKRYTLKCLKPDFAYTPVYRQALAKEFEIGLQMDHPHICRTISMEEVAELGTVIVMEYIDGDTLKSLIDSKTLTPDIKADIYSFGMVVRDMARLTGDAYLRRIAAACTRRNASERPADMSAVMSLPRTDNRQRIVVALLALVVAALTAYVAVTLYNRSTASDDARQDNAPIEIAPDSNRALDYTLWPERGEK